MIVVSLHRAFSGPLSDTVNKAVQVAAGSAVLVVAAGNNMFDACAYSPAAAGGTNGVIVVGAVKSADGTRYVDIYCSQFMVHAMNQLMIAGNSQCSVLQLRCLRRRVCTGTRHPVRELG